MSRDSAGEIYTSLAAVYDRLNAEVDYAAIADHIERQFGFMTEKPVSLLDLACGTGSLTLELARRGYDLIGVDLSEDMLAEARHRFDSAAKRDFCHDILLIRQNIADLELYGTVDAAVCCLDSLNYLTRDGELRRAFRHIHNYLNPDGLFIFDMNTPYKFEHIYGDNSYILEDDGILCAWQNSYNQKSRICDFYLSIFRECPDGLWERSDEKQRERCYSLVTLKRMLADTGFELLAVYDGWSENEPTDKSERWCVTAKKVRNWAKK